MNTEQITESLSEAAREAMGHEDATQAMKDSGNYRKGHCRIAGFDVTIEQPAGSYREGVDPDGTPWKTRMNHHYGALLKTTGADGEGVDAFFNPDIADEEFVNMPIFVIDQIDKDGKFDEHKIVFGMANKQEAKAAYISNYEPGWEGLGDIHQFDVESFKAWVMDKAKTKKQVISAVFEAAGGWRERIMGAGSLEEIESVVKSELTGKKQLDNQKNFTPGEYVYHTTGIENLTSIKLRGLRRQEDVSGNSTGYLHVSLDEETAEKWSAIKGGLVMRFKPTEATKEGLHANTGYHHANVPVREIDVKQRGVWKPIDQVSFPQPKTWYELGQIVSNFADSLKPKAEEIKIAAEKIGISQPDARRAISYYGWDDEELVKDRDVPVVGIFKNK